MLGIVGEGRKQPHEIIFFSSRLDLPETSANLIGQLRRATSSSPLEAGKDGNK